MVDDIFGGNVQQQWGQGANGVELGQTDQPERVCL